MTYKHTKPRMQRQTLQAPVIGQSNAPWEQVQEEQQS
jgi:hypothetical protein